MKNPTGEQRRLQRWHDPPCVLTVWGFLWSLGQKSWRNFQFSDTVILTTSQNCPGPPSSWPAQGESADHCWQPGYQRVMGCAPCCQTWWSPGADASLCPRHPWRASHHGSYLLTELLKVHGGSKWMWEHLGDSRSPPVRPEGGQGDYHIHCSILHVIPREPPQWDPLCKSTTWALD